MASQFVVDLVASLGLSDTESAVLSQAGVRSAEDVDSLLSSFPSLGTPPGAGGPALQVARISNAVAQRIGASYTTARGLMMAAPPSVGFGAQPPPRTVMTPGTQIGMPAPALPAVGAPPTSGGNVDLRLANWPVKDQGQRGTCVAFGTAACFEHHMAQPQQGAPSDRSEQFLYWAIKTGTGSVSEHAWYVAPVRAGWAALAWHMPGVAASLPSSACNHDCRPQP